MRKMLLIGGLAAAASLLNGCVIISCREHHVVPPPCVIYGPPCGVVEVVPVSPCPPPRPYWHDYYFYYGHRW
jgi:hypothetical protein